MLKIGLASVRGRLAKRPAAGGRRGTIPAGGPKIQKKFNVAPFNTGGTCVVPCVETECCVKKKAWSWRAGTPRKSPPKPISCGCWTCGRRAGSTGGRTRAVGPGAYERYATLGLFGHGGVVGVSNATGLREACAAVNGFLRSRFPSGTWTSIAVLFNPRMGLHRDIQNMPGHSNHALALGDYTGGRVWIEDDGGDSTAWLADKKGGRELRGRWLDMHDNPVSFDARRYHKVEPHEGSMWALAAYVPQAYARATEQHREALEEAGFPLPK